VRPGTEVHVTGIPVMVRDVENWKALQYYQNVQVLNNMQRAQQEGYDAFVVGCTLDVAVAEGKSMLDIPVVGISEIAYTLLMGSTTVISINPALQKLPYAPTDFAPITMVAFVPHILVIPAEVPANNLKEFVAWVKANPGKVSYASAGPGTPHHIAGEMFKAMAGVDMLQVPYKGTGPALIDLMANRVQFMSVEAVAALPHVRSGKLKALGVATPTRNPLAPDIPTVAEAGLPGFEVTAWYGVVAPVGIPQPAADLLARNISKALEDPAFREKLTNLGATPVGGTPEQFGEILQRENAKWAKAIKDANISID